MSGASEATFNGFWAAKETFNIPADATNISLSFSGLRADDRCVLELSGTILGDYFLNAHAGPGVMSFTTAAVDVPYTFTFVTDGQIASGFHSGENELLLIVNNTGWYNQDSGTRIMWGGDGTDVALNATLSYTIPEPSTFALLGIGAVSLIGFGWRRRVLIGRRLLVPLAIVVSSALGTSVLLASPTYFAETGHFYEVVSYTGGWDDAQTQATSAGGYLVTITSSAEQQFIENLLIDTGASTGGYWIGLTKATEGDFVWNNGEAVEYTHWLAGEPNNWNGIENRTEILWTKTSSEDFYDRRGWWNDMPEDGNALIAPYFTDIPIGGYIVETVPEPSTFALLAIGAISLIGFGSLRRRYVMRRLLASLVAMVVMFVGGEANAAAVQWSVSAGGNGHYYEAICVPGGIARTDADSAATAMGGYLATIVSAQENSFVYSLVDDDRFWVVGCSYGSVYNIAGPWLGAYQDTSAPDYSEPAGGWRWLNGEPFVYTNWYPSEPDDDFGGGQDSVLFYGRGTTVKDRTPMWDDEYHRQSVTRGYVVEFVPEPSTLVLFGIGAASLIGFGWRRRSTE